jgi:hypothetical protein
MDRGHYKIGSVDYTHKGKIIRSIVGSKAAIEHIKNLDPNDYQVGYVPNGYEKRPDLISNIFYRSPSYFWSIMFYSNLPDAFEDFDVGSRILIPRDE